MHEYVVSVIIGTGKGYAVAALFFAVLFALEVFLPRGKLPSWDARYRAILFAVVFIPVAAAVQPFMPGRFDPLPLGIAGAVAAPFLVDFFYYWLHRAQHANPILWRFHAVHHSVEELGALGGYHHVTEAPLKAILVVLPASLLVPLPIGVVAVLIAFHGNYIHSATRLHFGRLAWVVADNRTHRIHHSLEPAHFNRNFGAFTMIWDRLFGTAYFPRAEEWPGTGLAGHPEPRSAAAYLFSPFRRSVEIPPLEPSDPEYGSSRKNIDRRVGRSEEAHTEGVSGRNSHRTGIQDQNC